MRNEQKIKELVTDQAVDILFITESWLRPFDDEIKCADLTPSDHTINSFARNSKRIDVLAKNSLPIELHTQVNLHLIGHLLNWYMPH